MIICVNTDNNYTNENNTFMHAPTHINTQTQKYIPKTHSTAWQTFAPFDYVFTYKGSKLSYDMFDKWRQSMLATLLVF